MELQNRGSLHVHLLLWVLPDENISQNLILATTPEHSEITAKVKKYQIHTF